MRINPEFFNFEGDSDNDPEPDFDIKKHFKTIDNLDDLPPDYQKMLKMYKERIAEILQHEGEARPEENPLLAFTAFQEVRLHNIQSEIKNIHTMLLSLAKSIDEFNEQS